MFERMEELLDFEKPDLVVFTGDLIYAPPADSAYLDLLSHITSRNLPFAICFGNHDDNWGISSLSTGQNFRESVSSASLSATLS